MTKSIFAGGKNAIKPLLAPFNGFVNQRAAHKELISLKREGALEKGSLYARLLVKFILAQLITQDGEQQTTTKRWNL